MLYAELQRVDSALAQRLPPTDTQRILRGLEVYEATGEPLSQLAKTGAKAPLTAYWYFADAGSRLALCAL